MRRKLKILFEDIGSILIIIALIYGAYHIFFDKKPQENIVKKDEVKTIHKEIVKKEVTKKIKKSFEANETIIIDKNSTLEKDIPKVQDTKLIQKQKSIQENNTTTNTQKTKEEKTIKRKIEKKNIKVLGKFLFNLKSSVNDKLSVLKQTHKSNTGKNFVKIRITILDNGNYEQLKFMDGDKYFYDLAKEEIKTIFPVKIDERIKDQFPRYFRMKVSF